MQNEPNFRKSQMNVNNVLTRDYEKRTLGERGKNEPKTNPNEPKFKKAKMNVTSIIIKGYENKTPIRAPKKQTQSNPISKQLQSPIFPGHLLINRMDQICCVCGLTIPLDSAKMALYTNNWNLKKDGKKKLNLLKYKGLNGPSQLHPLTGTLFAHSYLGNIVLTN